MRGTRAQRQRPDTMLKAVQVDETLTDAIRPKSSSERAFAQAAFHLNRRGV